MKKLVFLATGEAGDPSTIDFRILGLHKNEFFDSKGDLVNVKYYTDYDQNTDTFTGLAVDENRTYERDATTGLLLKRSTNIDWYDSLGGVSVSKLQVEKYYSAQKAFVANKRARQNLIDKASMYLFQQLMMDNLGDAILSESQVEDFDTYTTTAQALYIKSTTQPLIDAINNAADSGHVDYKPYITTAIKTVLLSILDISYTA